MRTLLGGGGALSVKVDAATQADARASLLHAVLLHASAHNRERGNGERTGVQDGDDGRERGATERDGRERENGKELEIT